MCFTVHPKHKRAKVAKEDIICYKTFYKWHLDKKKTEVKSQWRGFVYKLGWLYELDGYMVVRKPWNEITVGLHSYILKPEHNWADPTIVIKCIIPKGAKYYVNPEYGEYVSDQIIIGTKDDITYYG